MQTKITPSRLDSTKDYTSLIPYTSSVANTGASFANGAFARANSSYTAQNTTAGFANSSYLTANSASNFANAAFTVANTAFVQSSISPFLLMGG